MKTLFKITTWEIYQIPEELKEDVLIALKTGQITNGNELYEFIVTQSKDESCNWEVDSELNEYITPQENGGFSTIEVTDNSNVTWDNSPKTPPTLYYVVEKHTQDVGGFEECTGWKTITVYIIEHNTPKVMCEIEAHNESSSEGEIQEWLDENGCEDKEFKFVQL